jgi:CubicO group peptidase (beta-lactamase class C family)
MDLSDCRRRPRVISYVMVSVSTWVVVNTTYAESVFPRAQWDTRAAHLQSLNAEPLAEVSEMLGGRGCVVKDGFVVHAWGDQGKRSDWMSAAKPVISTLLLFALQEGRIHSVDQPIADFGWDLKGKDRTITFRHLGAMRSGFRRVEPPGAAWAYNDPAIQLYQKTLFDKVFQADPHEVSGHPDRFASLQFEDGLSWRKDKRRLRASVRDFARIAWFWLNRGRWAERQILPKSYFDEYVTPQTPKDLPHTRQGEGTDYLNIGSYGGGSDHFTKYGAGIYGFNWWFNQTGRLHPNLSTWPDAPADTYMAIGAGGNCAVVFPSQNMVLVCADGNWGKLEGGKSDARMNRILARTAEAVSSRPNAPTITGPIPKWATANLDFHGPQTNASESDPNPFLDYRLQLSCVSPSGKRFDVAGFFAGDGNGGLVGDIWRVLFSPDEVGRWKYQVSFRRGAEVAVELEPDAGERCSFDSTQGEFTVGPIDPAADGFTRWGRLEYVGKHYLKCRDGDYWLKGGTDSPEDFLAYHGFVNTPKARHRYANHVADWQTDDPDWGNGQGKGIIGALNYLASQEVNSIYFLPMNIGGDGKSVYPYLGPINGAGSSSNDNLHFDLTKLHQWGMVFEHAQSRGILLHIVLNEAEEANKRELDCGELGVERKLFYRELIARYGHLPALQWNISEEYNLHYNLGPDRVRAFAQYIADVDAYDHPITVHHSSRSEKVWTPFLGDPLFTVTSFQENDNVSDLIESWRIRSREAGVPLVIGMDEFYPDKTSSENIDRHRREYLWPVYFSGGQIEFILDNLLKVEDFRPYQRLWQSMAYARNFMRTNLPFWEMEPQDGLLSGASVYVGKNNQVTAQVFAKEGEIYAVYLPVAENTGVLDLGGTSGDFRWRWFNPRTGLFTGEEKTIQAGAPIALGKPPLEPMEDWVALFTRKESTP